jgi:predicted N-formylglutamate amidohydrolase
MTRAATDDFAVLITCEHAGNRVPAEFKTIFAGQQPVLATHRGWDPGALTFAREMAAAFGAPLFQCETTRLVIDLNRSIGNPDLYSEFTRALPVATRRRIVDQHYRPHREPIDAWVAHAIGAGRKVVHIASHSFTPELNGQVRTADIGYLYDPRRPGEVALSTRWLEALQAQRPDLRQRRNYPYIGNSDGVCFRLRKLHPANRYVGVELEVNQRFVEAGGRPWPKLRASMLAALREALAESPFLATAR